MREETAYCFGEIAKHFRKRRKLSQQALATLLGVHRNTIGIWERGDGLPESRTIVLELADRLKLNEQEIRQILEASMIAPLPHTSIPHPRNPFFTGREEILQVLHTQLGAEQAVALTQSSALRGLGGVGKTQIALEYAYRHALEYSAVFWIGAETEEQILSGFLRIADALQLPERESNDQHRVAAAVQRWLSTHSQWLVIWDNVEDLALLERFLPLALQGATLLTTRISMLGTLAWGLDLLPMEQEEGVLFLLRRAKILGPEATREQVQHWSTRYQAATDLVKAMGGLPLALDQAGAYLEATQCGLSAYLDLFCTQQAALLQLRGEGVRDHPDSVATTFLLVFTATVEQHPAVGDLLRVCALLEPDAIPEELFRKAAAHLGHPLASVCGDALAWDRLLALASRSSLLSRHPETHTLSLHRLVQAVIADMMTEQERELWEERVIAALDQVLPEVLAVSEAATWKQWECLLPHTQRIIHHVGEACHSLSLATLLNKTGHFLRLQGRDAEAEPLFERALCIQEQVLDPWHPDVATSLANVALIYFNQGKYERVEPLFERALCIMEQQYGPLHPEVAQLLNNWAYTLRIHGQFVKARPLFERSLEIREQQFGPVHPLVANSLRNLADLSYEQGHYPEAEQLVRRALSIMEQTQGLSHPQIVSSLDLLANLLREQGKYREAEQMYRRGLSIWEQHLGHKYPRRYLLLDDLAECYRLQGRGAEAEQLYRESLALQEQMQSLGVSIPLLGLANLSRDRGHFQEAEQLYQRALQVRERQLGVLHPDTADIVHEFALLRHKQGQLSEALALATHALTIRTQSLGDAHAKTVAIQALFTQLVQEQERVEKGGAHSVQQTEALAGSLRERSLLERVVISAQSAATTSASEDDPFLAFLSTCCELHPRAWCRSTDLWQAYTQWAEEQQDRYPLSRGAFIAQLKARGCSADRTMSARIWRGIALVKTNYDGL